MAQVTLVAVSRTRKHLESPWAAAAATVPVVFNAREISLEDVDPISPGIRDILLAVLPNKEVRWGSVVGLKVPCSCKIASSALRAVDKDARALESEEELELPRVGTVKAAIMAIRETAISISTKEKPALFLLILL